MTSIATFPSDYSGNETKRRTADIIHFDYDKSYRNYDKDVRPADQIHRHILGFQHKNETETNNLKTHTPTDRQEEQHTDASSAATMDLQQESNTNTETRAPEREAEIVVANRVVKISDINIGKRFRKDLGSTDDLEERIRGNRLLYSVIVTTDNLLVDGARRIDLILSLFVSVGQQRLFPRTIMTKNLNRQIVVQTKEEVMYWFEQADYQDCRINAYPAFLSKAEENDYGKGVNLNLFSPNMLFIDLDAKRFNSDTLLQRALKQILKNNASLLHDVKPLVLWSGHGYHIIIPVNAKEALENFTDFTPYTTEPSKEFMQFAERFLSLNKADTANNPGFKSCLLRVPYTFNSGCVDEGIDAEVKIFQQWGSSKPLPDIDNLLIEFQTFLVDKKLKAELENKRKKFNASYAATNILPYAERLLHLSIPDHRKFATSLILAPYFVNIQQLSDNEAFCKIKEWLLRCDKVKNLEPSVPYFDDYTRKAIERARGSGIKSLKFQETLKVKNRELYGMLKEGYYN